MKIHQAFENFLANRNDLEAAILSSTKASWGGSGYSVELFPDGHYRVLWDGAIGNLYQSPGDILAIPPLLEDEYQQDGATTIEEPYFDNAIERLKDLFEVGASLIK